MQLNRGHTVARGARSIAANLALVGLLVAADRAFGQELEPRAFSPSPVGTTFVLGGFGKSEGGILFDPALDIDNVQADLWIATVGAGHTFGVGGRQARVLAVLPIAWGSLAGNVSAQARRQDLAGLVDPRFKLSVGLVGAPALTLAQFGSAPRRTAIGAGVTVVPMGHLRCATILIVGQQSIKFAYSTGTTTRRGSDFNTFNATWQLVMF
jgi:hypothetical protein